MNKVLVVLISAVVLVGVAVFVSGQRDEKSAAVAEEEKVLNIYNWSDYIAEDTIQNFEQEYGIKVTYDVFDSNEVLESKLLSGNTGFDVVVPSASFMGRQIQAGVFGKLDKSVLTNYANLDPDLMKFVADFDPGNEHSFPYLWGTTGIGYNPDKVREILGEDAPTDSWDLVMIPENLEKLSQCGVAFLDAPAEVIPLVLNYFGDDPNGFDQELIEGKVKEHLLKLRPHITYLHSSKFIEDLANGDICVAVGWSGDVFQAADAAAEADAGITVEYVIPKEGAGMWFDMLTIPKDAPHPKNAHLFLDYLLRPDVMASISDYVFYANANATSFDLIDKEVTTNPNIYPPGGVAGAGLYTFKVTPQDIDRVYTNVWRAFHRGSPQ